ncbi:MAG: HlyD family secretion protein [Chthoniobacterales bacterium]|nr:HlyD family secretion protein [Chthoniobacterales bacterium]
MKPKVLVTLIVVALALVSAVLMYSRYLSKPWTRDAYVRANVVGIAPRVAGPIIQIPVVDNQSVKKGDLLFQIDPRTFKAAVDQAQGQLDQAQAKLTDAEANAKRAVDLLQQNVISREQYDDTIQNFEAAKADVAAAEAALENAKLNLEFTTVVSPVDGYLTNVNTSPGTYVAAGEQLLALVDTSTFWVAAYFKETQIAGVQPNDKVRITLMGHSGQPFEGVVASTAWGIFVQDGSTMGSQLLPNVPQTIDWVRLPNRFPVRVDITGKPPVPLRIGQTASVAIARD